VRIPDPLPVRDLLEARELIPLDLKVLAGSSALDTRLISNPRIQKPGLALAGYLPYVKKGRLQVLGESEFAYLGTLGEAEATERLLALVSAGAPALVASKGLAPSQRVLDRCDELGIPFLNTLAQTSETIGRISNLLEERLAPWTQIHGVLVEVFSMGTLITGDAGIGKSECALELVYRGHRLVADDVVIVRKTRHSQLRGRAHPDLAYMLELRGVGIIDIRSHFGYTASSPEVDIGLSIHLEKFTGPAPRKEASWRDRLVLEDDRKRAWHELLGVAIPRFTMAVAPGRDVAIMVETAVRKCLLADRGVHDEREFLRRVDRKAAGGDEGAGDDA
jgi:HPr kinase/phosphorylase